MAGIICYDSYGEKLDHFTQWDANQEITISGLDLDPVPVFHICNTCSEYAYVVNPDIDGKNLKIDIPNILLQQDHPIILYAYYVYEDESAKTGETIVVPVIPRVIPDDYEYVENIEYISWAAMAEEAKALIRELQGELERGVRFIIDDAEPKAMNVLWFDTGY